MRRKYPYLEDSYFQLTLDEEREKRSILKDIDDFINQKQYIRITLLDWEENPIKNIEGIINSGSISKNGDSPVRRSANLSCAVDARSYDMSNSKEDFAINKKVFIECGVRNDTEQYQDWPIFWFPQGVFYIADFAINSSSSTSTNINLTLKDKMMGLNGDVGGTLPATVIFDSMDTQLPTGEYITQKVLVYNIIKELVNHYGDEDLNNIVIEDVPLRIRRIMQWNGNSPLYATLGADNIQRDGIDYTYSLEKPESGDYTVFNHGDDIGYIFDDFVITDDLVGNAGDTVVTILDEIKNLLGNYEYFYDVFGVFHFREIKNYLNTTQGKTVLSDMAEKEYLVEVNNERSVFTFTDETLLTSITVTPQYGNIKNDYIVQGLHQMEGNDISRQVMYHLAIDKKPRPIGKDMRLQVKKKVDYSELIETKTQILEQDKTTYNIQSKQESYYLTNIDRLERVIAQRNVNLKLDNTELLTELINLVAVNKPDGIDTPEQYWDLLDTGVELTDFIANVNHQYDELLLEIWGEYQGNIQEGEDLRIQYEKVNVHLQEAQRTGATTAVINKLKRELALISSQQGENFYLRNQMEGNVRTWFDELQRLQQKIDDENTNIRLANNQLEDTRAALAILDDELITLKAEIEELIAEIKALEVDTHKEDTNNPHYGKQYYSSYNEELVLYIEKDTGNTKASFVKVESQLPDVGNFNKIYKYQDKYYYWDGQTYQLVDILDTYAAGEYYTYDWRTKLYLDGVMAAFHADTDKGYYYEELAAFWPQVYDLQNQCFYGEEDSENEMISLTQGYYFLDFLDSLSTSFGEWSVDNIGRRTNVTVEDKINCLFQPEIPNVILIKNEHGRYSQEDWKESFALEQEKSPLELRQEAIENNMPYTQVDGEIYDQLSTGGYKNAAFDQIKYDLYLHTRYQKTVSATSIPVFYLEPNSRVTVSETATNTYGDFVVQNISLTLGPGANMSVACHETLERF